MIILQYNQRYSADYGCFRISLILFTVFKKIVEWQNFGNVTKERTSMLCIYGNDLICEKTGDFYAYHHYNHLGSEEKDKLLQYAGNAYEVLSCVEGDSYVLNAKGTYLYNECFLKM